MGSEGGVVLRASRWGSGCQSSVTFHRRQLQDDITL